MKRRVFAAALAATTSMILAGLAVAPAHAAPPGGPALDVPAPRLSAALSCGPFVHPERDTVLLVHGTGLNAEQSWRWNYEQTLPGAGFDVCAVTMPSHAMGDIQVSSEYVVAAVRTIANRTHRKVSIIGHSQGGLEPRWAIRWWPDVRARVSRYIGLGSPNHGLTFADLCAASGNCWPAVWQFAHGSKFLAALNSGGETPGPTAYTAMYSLTDELVQPAAPAATGALSPAANSSTIAVQDICPGRPVNHISLMDDAVVWAVVMQALHSAHPASARLISRAVCAQSTMPGLTPVDAAAGNASTYVAAIQGFNAEPGIHAEPPLKPYAANTR